VRVHANATIAGRRPVPGAGLPGLLGAAEKAEQASCGNHGTTIQFLDTPREAAAQAKKEGKLFLVLHVSGNFEDPQFT